MENKINNYIKRIRNKIKKEYAIDYYNNTLKKNYDLGAMAKQSVEIQINSILAETNK